MAVDFSCQKLHEGRLPTTGMVVMGAGSTQRPHHWLPLPAKLPSFSKKIQPGKYLGA